MKKVVYSLTIQNKKYAYSLCQKGDGVVRVECIAARINQDFLSADVASLLMDLPNLIVAEKVQQAKQNNVVRFRISAADKVKMEQKATKAGFSSLSEYLRAMALA